MQHSTWTEYGKPGTPTLDGKDVEQAIARLEQLWKDARSRANGDAPATSRDCRDRRVN